MTEQAPFSLRGKVALVTGAARGLGLAMATSLARAGALVLVNGREPDRLAPVVQGLRARGLDALPLAFDVADEEATAGAFAAIAGEQGHLDILVSNVGFRNRRPIGDLSRADIREMLEINLTAAFGLAKSAAEMMLPRRWGRLIMVTSVAGPLSRSGDAAYTASKAGLLHSLVLSPPNLVHTALPPMPSHRDSSRPKPTPIWWEIPRWRP